MKRGKDMKDSQIPQQALLAVVLFNKQKNGIWEGNRYLPRNVLAAYGYGSFFFFSHSYPFLLMLTTPATPFFSPCVFFCQIPGHSVFTKNVSTWSIQSLLEVHPEHSPSLVFWYPWFRQVMHPPPSQFITFLHSWADLDTVNSLRSSQIPLSCVHL